MAEKAFDRLELLVVFAVNLPITWVLYILYSLTHDERMANDRNFHSSKTIYRSLASQKRDHRSSDWQKDTIKRKIEIMFLEKKYVV